LITTILLDLVVIPASLILLIGWHEYGHFTAAKLLGVKVIRFAIGFGKPLWLKQSRDKTEYAICALPVGGYVKLADDLLEQPIYKRFIIILAGPFFNIILGVMLYWLVFVIGIIQPLPIIGKIEVGSLADKGGLSANQQIIAVDNYTTQTWAAVVLRIIIHLGTNDQLIITTKDASQKTTSHKIALRNWRLDALKPNPLSSLGIAPEKIATQFHLRQYRAYPAFTVALHETYFYWQSNVVVLKKLLTGVLSIQSLMGPLGLLTTSLQAAQQGFVIYLSFIAFISISLAFINFLPIPGLDGCYLVYLFIEALRRKPVSIHLQVLLLRLGFIALTVLMIQALMNDLLRLI
jgi:regulator of sigma E protease